LAILKLLIAKIYKYSAYVAEIKNSRMIGTNVCHIPYNVSLDSKHVKIIRVLIVSANILNTVNTES